MSDKAERLRKIDADISYLHRKYYRVGNRGKREVEEAIQYLEELRSSIDKPGALYDLNNATKDVLISWALFSGFLTTRITALLLVAGGLFLVLWLVL